MGLRETEETTEVVLERMENTLCKMEQMSFDFINITDRLAALTYEAREYANVMKRGSAQERNEAFESIYKILDQILETAFTVNNISHDMEKEAVYQRDTSENIKQIIEFLYAMTDCE